MTFYEKLVEKAKEMGYPSATKFFDAAEVNTNARLALKKTGRLSDTYKMRCARVLKCSVGDINRMMSEARAEELKKDWPDKVTCSPAKNEAEEIEAASPEPEEETFGLPIPPENEVVKLEGQPHFDPVPEPEPEPEQEPVPEAPPAPTADDVADAKIAEIKAQADSILTYHDRIKEVAKNTLAEQYTAMLRDKMLEVAMADLTDLCHEFLENQDAHKAMAFVDVSLEIVKLKENV